MKNSNTLIINNGDIAGLAALATLDRLDRAIIWHPVFSDPASLRRKIAIAEQTVHYGIEQIIKADFTSALPVETENTNSNSIHTTNAMQTLQDAGIVLFAAAEARKHRCGKLIWPTHGNQDYNYISEALERKILLNHIIDLNNEGLEKLTLDTPFLDLSDNEIVDIALRSDAPIKTAWWCDHDGDKNCGGCDQCNRWRKAFDKAGMNNSIKDSQPLRV